MIQYGEDFLDWETQQLSSFFPLGSESEEMSLLISAAYEEELLNHYDNETLEENSLWSIKSLHSQRY